ncbi:hypothetical protein LSCM1_07575 [Leishmania martiniquensis]|uniref:Uncharacterized protein n=1 Tax=Leishmania martiniquensis TaxID=1580590 RepID=A0A836HJY7_9TRYP|nr:hypothetical protein LSCM1_07575 [Leishmania martiniquensis]
MTSLTHSHASNTGSRCHHTPLLQERSNSLTRRREMLKRQSSQSFTSHSALQQEKCTDTDVAMPGTVVVCGVRSAFPLIPLTSKAPTAGGSAVLDVRSSSALSRPPHDAPTLGPWSSSAAAALSQPQHRSSDNRGGEPLMNNVADSAGLPHALRSCIRTPRSPLDRPPRARSYDGQRQQQAGFDVEADSEKGSLDRDAEVDEEEAAEHVSAVSSDAGSPQNSDAGSSEAYANRFGTTAEVTQPLVSSQKDASSQAFVNGAPSHSQPTSARASTHAIVKANMIETQEERCSIHAGSNSSSSGVLDDGQAESVEECQRDDRYLVQESFQRGMDDDGRRRALHPAKPPRLHTPHARHKQVAVSPYTQATATAYRRSVKASVAKALASRTDPASATSAARLLAMTEGRHRSPAPGKESPIARSDAMPAALQTIGPRVMSASSLAHARQKRSGMCSIQASATEVARAHSPSLQTQEPRLMSAPEARRWMAHHAVESEDPLYTDEDQQPGVLKTMGLCNLSRPSVDPSRANSGRSIYSALFEHPSESPVPAEASADQLHTQRASCCSSGKASPSSPMAPQKESIAGAAAPSCAPVSEGVAQRPSSQDSRRASSGGTSDSEERQESHLPPAERAAPDAVTKGTAVGAGGRRLSAVAESQSKHQLQTREGDLEDGDFIDGINWMGGKEQSIDERCHRPRHAEEMCGLGGAASRGSGTGGSFMSQHHLRMQASIKELNDIRSSCAIVQENRSEAYAVKCIDACGKSSDSTEYVSCYNVACQTSQHLLQSSRDEVQVRVGHHEGEVDEVEVGKFSPLAPHYVGVNRWMCATGVCPECHPNWQARGGNNGKMEGRVESTWPLAPRVGVGYSAPPRLLLSQKHHGPEVTVTAGCDARLPQLLSSCRSSARAHPQHTPARSLQPHAQIASPARQRSTYITSDGSGDRHYRRDHYSPTVTSYQGGYCFTREWDLQQQQRRRWLRELQMEQRARRGATGAAYTSMLPLTRHVMQSRAQTAGEEPRSYRYCDLHSQQMMIHTGLGRADLGLDSYNDTLHGAPLIEAWQGDDDGAMRAIGNCEARRQIKPSYLVMPTSAAVIAADHSGHTRPAADSAAKVGQASVLYCKTRPHHHSRLLRD